MLSVCCKLEPGECKILGDTTMNILPTLVQLSNRREFILVRSVFISRDTGKNTRRHNAKDKRETRASPY